MKLFCSSVLFLLWLSQLSGQPPNQTRKILFHALTVEDNLTSQESNDYIYRDSKGYVWISSITGLNLYDGSIVRQFRPNIRDTTSILEPNIQSPFFEDRDGNIWFSTSKAIQCYLRDKDHFRGYPFDSTFLARETFPELVYLDSLTGTFWLATEEGLYSGNLSDPQRLVHKDDLSGISGIGVRTFLFPGNNGTILFIPKEQGWEMRLYNPEEQGFQAFLPQFETFPSKSYTVHFESSEIILVGTDSGLLFIDANKDSFHLFREFNGQEIKKIVGIHSLDEERSLLVTQNGKFFLFNTPKRCIVDQWSGGVVQRRTPLPTVIHQSYMDTDKNLWLSTHGQGVYFANINKWKFRSFLTNDPGNEGRPTEVRSMAEDSSGNIWCLSGQGISIVNPRTGDVKAIALSPEEFDRQFGNNPLHLYIDLKDRVWIGSPKGLFIRSPQTGIFRSITENSFPKLLVTQMQELRSGRMLVSTNKGIGEIVEIKGEPTFQFIPEDHNKKGLNTLIKELRDQRLLISKWEENIQIFRQSLSGHIHLDTSLVFTPMVNGWVEDSRDSLIWLASSQGLFKLNIAESGYEIQADTLFPIETLNGILEDKEGFLWLSSSQGFLRYDKQGTLNRFSQADGIKYLQFRFWSYLKTQEGKFFFGSTNGINFVQPEYVKLLEVAARPTISELWVNDTYYKSMELKSSKSNPEVFRYNQNTLSFFFTALEYSDPGKNKFKFKMSGVDKDFVELNKGNSVRYANLPHGSYQLQLMATNSDGIWSEDLYSFHFRILPPWYKTWLFRISIFLLTAGVVIAVVNYRLRQVRKEAYLKQLIAETETAVLRLQMNPHFIFNSLSSVQNALLNNDEIKANQILRKFIPLMRKILEHSEKPFIVIADEIELLDQYLMIEAIRFDNKFDYSFFVDPQLDPEEIMVPTMILQPFVENAIKHGLSRKLERNGKIEVHFLSQEEGLLCIVRDNGIGRKEAQRSKAWKGGHESKATEITERRLRLLENQEDYTTGLKIIDLTDEMEAPSGTEVQLILPLIR